MEDQYRKNSPDDVGGQILPIGHPAGDERLVKFIESPVKSHDAERYDLQVPREKGGGALMPEREKNQKSEDAERPRVEELVLTQERIVGESVGRNRRCREDHHSPDDRRELITEER